MSTEAPLTERERARLKEILNDAQAMDSLVDKALKGWRKGKILTKRTKRP